MILFLLWMHSAFAAPPDESVEKCVARVGEELLSQLDIAEISSLPPVSAVLTDPSLLKKHDQLHFISIPMGSRSERKLVEIIRVEGIEPNTRILAKELDGPEVLILTPAQVKGAQVSPMAWDKAVDSKLNPELALAPAVRDTREAIQKKNYPYFYHGAGPHSVLEFESGGITYTGEVESVIGTLESSFPEIKIRIRKKPESPGDYSETRVLNLNEVSSSRVIKDPNPGLGHPLVDLKTLPKSEYHQISLDSTGEISGDAFSGGKYFGLTDGGHGKREVNEDAVLIVNRDKKLSLVVVDGMGGPSSGEIASDVITRSIAGDLVEGKTLQESFKEAGAYLEKAMASRPVYERDEMGAVAVGMQYDGNFLHFCHTGDSRGMVLNVRNKARKTYDIAHITKDHSVVQELVDRGAITEAQAFTHGRRNEVTEAIRLQDGGDLVPYKVGYSVGYQMNKGDWAIVASDGLWDVLTNKEVADILVKSSSPEDATRKLRAEIAVRVTDPQRKAKDDNVAILVFQP